MKIADPERPDQVQAGDPRLRPDGDHRAGGHGHDGELHHPPRQQGLPALVDDFIDLKILPDDCDRAKVIPLMDKALSPYVKGGGAKKYEAELKSMYNMEDGSLQSTAGGFQAMTQDLLTVLNDIPFSIPPYFALLGRAVVTLEGIALIGNPDYRLVMEAYPFVARKLLREDRPSRAARVAGGALRLHRGRRIDPPRSSLGGDVEQCDGASSPRPGDGVFVDLDTVPEDGVTLAEGLTIPCSAPAARRFETSSRRKPTGAADVLLRQAAERKSGGRSSRSSAQPPKLPFPLPFAPPGVPLTAEGQLPNPEDVPGRWCGVRARARVRPRAVARARGGRAETHPRGGTLRHRPRGPRARAPRGRTPRRFVAGDALLEPEATASLDARRARASGRAPGLDNLAGGDARALASRTARARGGEGCRRGCRRGCREGPGRPRRRRRSSRRCAISHRRKPRRFARRRRAWATPCGRD